MQIISLTTPASTDQSSIRKAIILNVVVIDALVNAKTQDCPVNVTRDAIQALESHPKLRNILADESYLSRISKEWAQISIVKTTFKELTPPKSPQTQAEESHADKIVEDLNATTDSSQDKVEVMLNKLVSQLTNSTGLYFANAIVSVVKRNEFYYFFNAKDCTLTIGTQVEITNLIAQSHDQLSFDVRVFQSGSFLEAAGIRERVKNLSFGQAHINEEGVRRLRHVFNQDHNKLKTLEPGDAWGAKFYKAKYSSIKRNVLINRYANFSNPYQSPYDVFGQCIAIVTSPLSIAVLAIEATIHIFSTIIYAIKFLIDAARGKRPIQHAKDAGSLLLESFGLLCAAPFTPLLLTAGLINRAIATGRKQPTPSPSATEELGAHLAMRM